MSRYARLGEHLVAHSGGDSIQLRFRDIERLLGFRLPDSARSHRAWWANENGGSHSHAKHGWIMSGFLVASVDFPKELVSFRRAPGSTPARAAGIGEARIQRGISGPHEFEDFARVLLEKHFRTPLQSRKVGTVNKVFDYVSPDDSIVGDAKYFSLVRGMSPPPAKFSIIAEHIWLLEKLRATRKFIVFGNDKRVPIQWLKRYGNLRGDVAFYFLNTQGELEELAG